MGASSRDVSLLIGGQQGEGLESIGEMVSQGLSRFGFSIYSFRTFSSRIKGGHTNVKIRISRETVHTNMQHIDLLVAFDQETILLNEGDLIAGSVLLMQAGLNPPKNSMTDVVVQSIDFKQLAMNAGGVITKNLVALGSISANLDFRIDDFDSLIEDKFRKKGTTVIEYNLAAFREGYRACLTQSSFPLDVDVQPFLKPMMVSGNEAIALGAIAAGCKFMAGYPITPASEVLENLVNIMPKFGGVVVQTEDELAAVNMALGASYSGVRAMTATSGPGLSLMQETIGLSGMTEIPLVIVDLQRGGPSSGMATKHEQSDLFAMLHGTHGEVPRIVIAPSTIEEAFYDMIRAFNYAERYQCPVFVAGDLVLATSRQTVPDFRLDDISIDRGNHVTNQQLCGRQSEIFNRYRVTEEIVSARSVPGQPKGMHHVTGIEHGDSGYPSENPENRVKMMNKRSEKIQKAYFSNEERVKFEGDEEADILFVGFGSTYGPIREARLALQDAGKRVSHAQIRIVSPFPTALLQTILQRAETIIVVENNSLSQLSKLLKSEVACHERCISLCKYNGTPFETREIVHFSLEVMNHVGHSQGL